jgi:hypothetical protein
MVNAWSLLYDEYYGTMNETFPVKKKEEPDDTIVISTGSTDSATFVNFDLNDPNLNVGIDTSNLNFDIDLSTIGVDTGAINLEDVGTINWDMDPALSYMEPGTVLKSDAETIVNSYADTWPHAETLNVKMPDDYPSEFTTLSDNDDAIAHHVTTPTPGIAKDCNRKYKEDESIKALQDYISTTYGGHYTSDNNNVQTLDLIESVGDAESFCRSNAIKYLSRYDKKGQAKRDILKALHYSLLLYHFSGQLNETQTRGYETF